MLLFDVVRFFWPVFALACGSETVPPEPPRCGDGRVDPDEECDAGLANDDVGDCKRDCTAQRCGDGFVGEVEACDDGASNRDEGLCRSDCSVQRCGDGSVGPAEACDDGNALDSDECTSACALATCGDGIVQPPEACDDADADEQDECLPTCLLARCGDGVVRSDLEECDDANADDVDGCTSGCFQSSVVFGACGEAGWEPAAEEIDLGIFHGVQGCCHFYGCLRELGVRTDPPVQLAYEVVDDLGIEWAPFVDRFVRPDDWLEDGDGYRELLDFPFIMSLSAPEDLEGRVLGVTVRVTEDDGDVLTDDHTVRVHRAD